MDREEAGAGPASCCGALVVFGASGDLVRRKLVPALYSLDHDGRLPAALRIVGFARSAKTDEAFRAEMRRAVEEFSRRPLTADAWPRFVARLHYLAGEYDRAADYAALERLLVGLAPAGSPATRAYYLALPPAVAETALGHLVRLRRELELSGVRVMIEKPFGSDLASASRMNRLCAAGFSESEICRIDHYLAKDTVRNLLVLRLGNAIFEELWNRRHVESVQITAAETLGVAGRAGYYDGTGVVRDMIQSHLLQVMALVAMEPPLPGDWDSVHDHRIEVFKSLAPVGPEDFVFGQYRGYLGEPGVAAGSRTPTFAALRLEINNWRWRGVPFYLRSGKALARRSSEVVIQFKPVPLCLLENSSACQMVQPNTLSIQLHPDEGLRLAFNTRVPGHEDRIGQAQLDFRYAQLGAEIPEAYERVLLDALSAQPLLSWWADEVEAAWRAVAPLIEAGDRPDGPAPPAYEPGSWGPPEAAALPARYGHRWLPA